MSRKCALSGKKPLVGNNVSHAKNRTKMKQLPNLLAKKFYIGSIDRTVKLKIAKSTLRTIDKIGIDAYIKKNNININSLVN